MSWASAVKRTTKQAPSAPSAPSFQRPAFDPAVVDSSRLVRLDFETYYDDDYTLSKLSTSEYIRDPRFEALMVGIRVGNAKTKVVPGPKIAAELRKIPWAFYDLLCHHTHFDGLILSHHYGIVPRKYYCSLSMARGLHSNDIGAGLDDVSKYYDGAGKLETGTEDFKGLSYKALFANKVKWGNAVRYCGQDVDEMDRIFWKMLPKMPASEIDLIHTIVRMFCDPVLKVDIPRVEKELAREIVEREERLLTAVDEKNYSEAEVKEILKTKAERALIGKERQMLFSKRVIGSGERFAALLRAEGVEPPVKISPAWMKKPVAERDDESKWTYAFAKDDLDFTSLPDRIEEFLTNLNLNKKKDILELALRQTRLQQLVDARLAVKSTTNITRAERFLKAGANGMPLPVGYAYYRAHTGRLGGSNKMNMQNLKRGGELRLSILAPKGHEIVVVDSGQIEARVNGWLWGQEDLLDAFRAADTWDKARGVARGSDRDAYCKMGDLIYGREITTDDKTERFVGKVCVLGLGYQMGAPKLQITLAKGALGGPPVYFELDKCHQIVNAYRRKNHRIESGWQICKGIIEDMAAGVRGSHGPISWEKETLWLPNGMALKYPDLKKRQGDKGFDEWTYQGMLKNTPVRKKIYGGLLCENIVQALARIIVMAQLLEIDKKYRVVMTTHDENVALAKTKQAPAALKFMLAAMRKPLPWCADIPLNAEGGHALNYSK